jgi:predicted anti-sigma-YlaC factor YlaD
MQRAPALRTAHRVRADPARNRKQPHAARRSPFEPRERAQRPRVGLLHEVVDIVPPTEIRAVAPDVILGVSDEGGECGLVAGGRGPNDLLVVVHGGRRYGAKKLGNQPPLTSDCWAMECSKAREALSAGLDGETDPTRDAALIAHVRACAACRHFLESARDLTSLTRDSRPEVPDLTAGVLRKARAERHHADPLTTTLRIGLVTVAIAQLALAMPGLIYGSDEGAPIHIAHEVGTWDLALAVAFLFAAWRPLRAVGLLPFAATLSAGLIFTAVLDVAHGSAVALTETTHLLELIGAALLYLLMAPRSRSRAVLQLA